MATIDVNTRVTLDLMPKVLAALAELAAREVLVGVPAEEAWREKVPGEPSEPINNAALAYIHNYGAPTVNIPARPFMLPGILNVRDQIIGRLRIAAAAAASGKGQGESIDASLTAIGLLAQFSIRNKINTGPFAPLQPRTIARRKAADRSRKRQPREIRPLVDTSQMRTSINYVIRDRD